jgi:hypothetical protein
VNRKCLYFALLCLALLARTAVAADGVFVRLQLVQPAEAAWFVKLSGYIHRDPWHLPDAVWPAGADQDDTKRVPGGEFSPWFDLGTHAGKKLHGQLKRAGGIAEFPNVTAEFGGGGTNPAHRVVIQLATAPDDAAVVKRLEESFNGRRTSFLVSPNLRADADALETASQMTARRLAWARESSGGRRVAPTNVFTSTLVADHPYFGGSGLGMGMDGANTTWGGFPLSLDWFGLARERVVDVIGIED